MIPRSETEAYTIYLVELLQRRKDYDEITRGIGIDFGPVNVLDLCSGSGCISLLMHQLLSESGSGRGVNAVGMDISVSYTHLN